MKQHAKICAIGEQNVINEVFILGRQRIDQKSEMGFLGRKCKSFWREGCQLRLASFQCEAGHYGSSTRGVFKSNKEQSRGSLDTEYTVEFSCVYRTLESAT